MQFSKKSLDLAKLIIKTQQYKYIRFVEIGVYNGANAACIGTCLKNSGKEGEYVGFDFFEDASLVDLSKSNPGVYKNLINDKYLQKAMSKKSIYDLLRLNYKKVTLIKGDSKLTIPQNIKHITNANVYFIDGAHTYSAVKSDYNYISSVAKKDSLIVLDDPHIEGIAKFINELKSSGKAFSRVTGSIYTIGG